MQIAVASRQVSTRRAISQLIKTRLGLNVVGEAGNERELMDLLKAYQLDLVLLDSDLPGAASDEIVSALCEADPHPAVIVLDEQPEMESELLAAGADAYVYKGDPPKQLLIAIENIHTQRQR